MPQKKLIVRLQAGLGVSDHDRTMLATMPHRIKTFTPGEYIWHQGDNTARCTIVMSGFLAREKLIAARNQILSIYVPGDIPDLQTLHLPVNGARSMEHWRFNSGLRITFLPGWHIDGITGAYAGILARDADRCSDLPRGGGKLGIAPIAA